MQATEFDNMIFLMIQLKHSVNWSVYVYKPTQAKELWSSLNKQIHDTCETSKGKT